MTYCIGLRLNRGLVFMSDTRTNAGIDNISSFRKMRTFSDPGKCAIVLLSAGNLATTQSVVSLLEERTKAPADRQPAILVQPTMFQVARLVGETLREVIQNNAKEGHTAEAAFEDSVILGGQVAGSPPRIFMIYPEGNFIEADEDTAFFQIGETKYGKPILVRAYDPNMSFGDAVRLMMVSFDSTIKANLSVGLPLDLQIMETGALTLPPRIRIEADDPNYQAVSNGWGQALKSALSGLPSFEFEEQLGFK